MSARAVSEPRAVAAASCAFPLVRCRPSGERKVQYLLNKTKNLGSRLRFLSILDRVARTRSSRADPPLTQ